MPVNTIENGGTHFSLELSPRIVELWINRILVCGVQENELVGKVITSAHNTKFEQLPTGNVGGFRVTTNLGGYSPYFIDTPFYFPSINLSFDIRIVQDLVLTLGNIAVSGGEEEDRNKIWNLLTDNQVTPLPKGFAGYKTTQYLAKCLANGNILFGVELEVDSAKVSSGSFYSQNNGLQLQNDQHWGVRIHESLLRELIKGLIKNQTSDTLHLETPLDDLIIFDSCNIRVLVFGEKKEGKCWIDLALILNISLGLEFINDRSLLTIKLSIDPFVDELDVWGCGFVNFDVLTILGGLVGFFTGAISAGLGWMAWDSLVDCIAEKDVPSVSYFQSGVSCIENNCRVSIDETLGLPFLFPIGISSMDEKGLEMGGNKDVFISLRGGLGLEIQDYDKWHPCLSFLLKDENPFSSKVPLFTGQKFVNGNPSADIKPIRLTRGSNNVAICGWAIEDDPTSQFVDGFSLSTFPSTGKASLLVPNAQLLINIKFGPYLFDKTLGCRQASYFYNQGTRFTSNLAVYYLDIVKVDNRFILNGLGKKLIPLVAENRNIGPLQVEGINTVNSDLNEELLNGYFKKLAITDTLIEVMGNLESIHDPSDWFEKPEPDPAVNNFVVDLQAIDPGLKEVSLLDAFGKELVSYSHKDNLQISNLLPIGSKYFIKGKSFKEGIFNCILLSEKKLIALKKLNFVAPIKTFILSGQYLIVSVGKSVLIYQTENMPKIKGQRDFEKEILFLKKMSGGGNRFSVITSDKSIELLLENGRINWQKEFTIAPILPEKVLDAEIFNNKLQWITGSGFFEATENITQAKFNTPKKSISIEADWAIIARRYLIVSNKRKTVCYRHQKGKIQKMSEIDIPANGKLLDYNFPYYAVGDGNTVHSIMLNRNSQWVELCKTSQRHFQVFRQLFDFYFVLSKDRKNIVFYKSMPLFIKIKN